jgi:cell division protein FtsB
LAEKREDVGDFAWRQRITESVLIFLKNRSTFTSADCNFGHVSLKRTVQKLSLEAHLLQPTSPRTLYTIRCLSAPFHFSCLLFIPNTKSALRRIWKKKSAGVRDVFISYLALFHLPEELALVFGLTRKSKYEELQKQHNELKAYMNILNSEVETLRKEISELRKDTKVSKRKIWQLQQETNSLRIQKDGLADHVEMLTKEREIFQRTIETLCKATRKQKRTNLT